ncbi:MAG: sulfatase-like hydrolase/transferase [Acidobacteriota bacterium]
MLAGIHVAAAYAALEMFLTGPLNSLLVPNRLIGFWFLGSVFTYAALCMIFGGLIGAVTGAVLGRLGRKSYHVNYAMSAILTVAFSVNAIEWTQKLVNSPFLLLAIPIAAWLLFGLLSDRADPARDFLGSPWPTAIILLVPVWLSREMMIDRGLYMRLAASGSVVAVVLVLALLARSKNFVTFLASWRLQAALSAFAFIVSFAMLQFLCPRSILADSTTTPGSNRPNVVLISLDTTRADHLSVYGYSRRTTPKLEAFAAGATLYRHAYANGDMTLPSHASMLTGLYPTQHGAHADHSLYTAISDQVPTLSEVLRTAGYRNYGVVANFIFLDPRYGFARGFDTFLMPRPLPVVSNAATYLLRTGLYSLSVPWLWTDAMRRFFTAEEIASVGETFPSQAGGKPFFLFLNFMESHRPLATPGHFRKMFPGYDQGFDELEIRSFEYDVFRELHTVTPEEMAKMHADYDGGIAYMDDTTGRLLERLKKQPWYDASLVIITSDHGELFGEKHMIDHGNSVDHGITGIPMIVKFPHQQEGRVVDSPVSQVDIFATIAAVAGAPVPPQTAGTNLAAGDPGEDRSIILESYPTSAYITLHKKMDRMERALVRGRWKMIRSNRGRRELYDMVSDPGETRNLWNAQPEMARDLDGRMRDWVATGGGQTPLSKAGPSDPEMIQRLKSLGYAQ